MSEILVDILVPDLGEGVKEVTIVDWLKKPGDTLTIGDPFLEVMTDKANIEVEASVAGILSEVLEGKDAVVEVGAKIGTVSVVGPQ